MIQKIYLFILSVMLTTLFQVSWAETSASGGSGSGDSGNSSGSSSDSGDSENSSNSGGSKAGKQMTPEERRKVEEKNKKVKSETEEQKEANEQSADEMERAGESGNPSEAADATRRSMERTYKDNQKRIKELKKVASMKCTTEECEVEKQKARRELRKARASQEDLREQYARVGGALGDLRGGQGRDSSWRGGHNDHRRGGARDWGNRSPERHLARINERRAAEGRPPMSMQELQERRNMWESKRGSRSGDSARRDDSWRVGHVDHRRGGARDWGNHSPERHLARINERRAAEGHPPISMQELQERRNVWGSEQRGSSEGPGGNMPGGGFPGGNSDIGDNRGGGGGVYRPGGGQGSDYGGYGGGGRGDVGGRYGGRDSDYSGGGGGRGGGGGHGSYDGGYGGYGQARRGGGGGAGIPDYQQPAFVQDPRQAALQNSLKPFLPNSGGQNQGYPFQNNNPRLLPGQPLPESEPSSLGTSPIGGARQLSAGSRGSRENNDPIFQQNQEFIVDLFRQELEKKAELQRQNEAKLAALNSAHTTGRRASGSIFNLRSPSSVSNTPSFSGSSSVKEKEEEPKKPSEESGEKVLSTGENVGQAKSTEGSGKKKGDNGWGEEDEYDLAEDDYKFDSRDKNAEDDMKLNVAQFVPKYDPRRNFQEFEEMRRKEPTLTGAFGPSLWEKLNWRYEAIRPLMEK